MNPSLLLWILIGIYGYITLSDTDYYALFWSVVVPIAIIWYGFMVMLGRKD